MTESTSFSIEIDGVELDAYPGEMVIQVADRAGLHIPRFCYHEKLSVAANCRMCMVQVDKVPKPLPACATPVCNGMKVRTRSKLAIEGQKGSMEFLLINHPLDCPICDQGGECELQDVAMGYGSDISRFNEGKRVVFDKNIGPLISTEMTRCIHCTRCVRFGTEVAAMREMGATGRGEHMEIGTYIEKSVDSELSGNMIDVCPVGALTAKPSRFKARAWELIQKPGIGLHDSLGSNLGFHVRRNTIFRVVPVANESINEVWLSDRDRFSYEGIYHPDRLTSPMVRTSDGLHATSWDTALETATAQLKKILDEQGGNALGGLIKANEPIEAMAQFKSLLNGLGSANLDHRLRQSDFRTQGLDGVPCLGKSIELLEQEQSILVIGSNLCKEQPLLAHRIRKMVERGGQLMAINPVAYEMRSSCLQDVASNKNIINSLSNVLKVVCDLNNQAIDNAFSDLSSDEAPTETQQQIARTLIEAESASILLGAVAQAHPDYAVLISLASAIAKQTSATLGYLHGDSNSVGAHLVNVLPGEDGLDALQMLQQPRAGYLLAGVEPGFDCQDPATAQQALSSAQSVIAFSHYRDSILEQYATVIFPVTGFGETQGTYVNLSGQWQSVSPAIKPTEQIRPITDVLIELQQRLFADDDQNTADALISAARDRDVLPMMGVAKDLSVTAQISKGLQRIGEVPLYRTDDLVRHAPSLQQTVDADDQPVRIHPDTAYRLGMENDAYVTVKQAGAKVQLPLVLDSRVAEDCVWLASGTQASSQLGAAMGTVELSRTLL